MSVSLGGFPYGKGALVLHIVNLHLHILVESGYESGECLTNLQTVELVFTNIEGAPEVAHDGNGHDGRTGTYQFAHLGIDVGNLALHLGNLYGFVDVGVDLIDSTLGTAYQSGSGLLVLVAGTVLGHFILALGSLVLGFHGLVVGIHLVALLGTHHALVEETLDALV